MCQNGVSKKLFQKGVSEKGRCIVQKLEVPKKGVKEWLFQKGVSKMRAVFKKKNHKRVEEGVRKKGYKKKNQRKVSCF